MNENPTQFNPVLYEASVSLHASGQRYIRTFREYGAAIGKSSEEMDAILEPVTSFLDNLAEDIAFQQGG